MSQAPDALTDSGFAELTWTWRAPGLGTLSPILSLAYLGRATSERLGLLLTSKTPREGQSEPDRSWSGSQGCSRLALDTSPDLQPQSPVWGMGHPATSMGLRTNAWC